jgi:copper homeostasis protein CutC
VLTTGGPWATAYAGIPELRKLNQFCRNDLGGAISIMPGSGVTLDNAKLIIEATGVTEIHGSFQGDMDTIQSVKVSLLQRNK